MGPHKHRLIKPDHHQDQAEAYLDWIANKKASSFDHIYGPIRFFSELESSVTQEMTELIQAKMGSSQSLDSEKWSYLERCLYGERAASVIEL